jgi:hypothetical protein
MVDKVNTARLLAMEWLALARYSAVTAGVLVAIVSLLLDVPLQIASLRGALTLVALLVVIRCAQHALAWSSEGVERPQGGPRP